jgi:mono/diheme cytochrome c family protein
MQIKLDHQNINAAMKTFPFLNQQRRKLLIRVCVMAVLGCILFANAMAQNTVPFPANSSPALASTNLGPTYLGDIQPIFMGNCSRCHNQESRFVYNWLDYKTAYADRWEIKRRIWDSWKGSYYKESMPVANSPESGVLTDEERALIRNWVVSGAPKGVPPPPGAAKTKAERIALGQRLFSSICAACHQPTGQGRPNVFPPLAGSDFLNADKDRAIQTVIFGRQGQVVVNGMPFNNSMPSFPLTDQNIAYVLTFVYNSFGNSGLDVTPDEVKVLRANPPAPTTLSAPSATSVPKSQFE